MSAGPTPQTQAAGGRTWAQPMKNEDNGREAVVASPQQGRTDRLEHGAPNDRVSPDPLRSTDRYRLVTPHAFRL